ncbi:Putative multidrug resistance protein MdtD [Sporomusa acidovorans DSM 3132]|uniref:Multidrug resistance protein MdtD n=2 Tax=Sporomusa TaxID=2375 RepID=A0ABZ3IYR9_SPOA4|nr:DHA2 family efflux MFS transporter permease subunit [Sporomusa acidovorans]OZC14173.1 multidrug export protein EmrB [Sporomusa acidovorans DSM 3132]SDE70352.1 drug resistance transporter, EmrB/QacA subfamily [Sporomusa acidovorans]
MKKPENLEKIPWPEVMTLIWGCFMAILDTSIVNTALPTMRATFGGDADSVQWVVTAYMLTSGMVIPVTGFLCDRFGNKRIYLISLSIFIGGSVLCAAATSNNFLIFARVIQAIGGGIIMPVSMSMIRIIVPREKMGMAMGIWGVSAMGAPSIGPTLGGYIVVHLGWQWIFTINLPIGIIAIVLGLIILRETPQKTGLKLDVLGFILSASACFALLLALSKGQDEGWTSLYIVSLLIYTVGASVLFVLWENTTEQPLIDLQLLKNRTYCISILAVSLSNIAMYSITFLIPIYSQNIRGLTALQSGQVTMPSALAIALMMPVSGRLFDRFGAAPLCVAGFSIAGYYSYQLHTLTADTSFTDMQWILVKRAIGLGLAMMPVSTAGINTIPKQLAARASAINNVVRQIAGSFGIALITYVMMHRQIYHNAWLSETLNWSSSATVIAVKNLQSTVIHHGISSSAVMARYCAEELLGMSLQQQAYLASVNDAMLVPAIIVSLTVPLGFFLNKKAVENENSKQHARLIQPASSKTL